MAPLSSTLAWKITWTEEPVRLQSMGSLRVGHNWATSLSFSLSCIGEGNGNPLQYSCLENPRDGGAWWAAIYGVVQSRTRLKWLSNTPWKKAMTHLDSILKSRDITLSTKICLVKAISIGHVWMWELDCEESWVPKNWCFWTVMLDCKEIQPVHSKGDQLWDLFGRTHAKAETPIVWPPHAKSWLIGKISDAGRDWGQEEKGDNRGWDGWMASLTPWTWVWMNSRRLWWTGRPGVLRFMGLQRVGQDWATELNWTEGREKRQVSAHRYGISSWGHEKFFNFNIWHVCLVAQSCPSLCDPMDCSPPESSVHGVLQARILEWAAMSSSKYMA